MAAPTGGGMLTEDPSMTVELHISCQGLVNLDVGSLTDPIVLVRTRDSPATPWVDAGRTEQIKDSLNPNFVTALRVKYRFEVPQRLSFAVWDVDKALGSRVATVSFGEIERSSQLVGVCEASLAEIVTDRGGVYTAALTHPHHGASKRGTIRVVAEEVRGGNDDEVRICVEGRKLAKKDLLGKSDPYLIISQIREGVSTGVAAYRTEVLKKTLDPHWQPIAGTVQKLCNGDLDRPLLVECWDWNANSAHEIIGRAETSLRALLAAQSGKTVELQLMNEKKGKKIPAGTIVFSNAELKRMPSFVEYLKGGLEIGLVAAIDFTASNQAPTIPTSLHYNGDPSRPNAYVQAIGSVGAVLAAYDRDGMIPAYGFGARLPDGNVSHCFAINGNPSNPEVPGVAGIISSYETALRTVTLYGPTCFAPVIQTTMQIAAMNAGDAHHQRYFVLLIITDGAINDMQATVDTLVAAANTAPMSVVIVGVGNADFGSMNVLDADDTPLRASNGTVPSRDIVQFVQMNRYATSGPAKLAEDTLAEVPRQVIQFFRARNVLPNPPPTVAPPQ